MGQPLSKQADRQPSLRGAELGGATRQSNTTESGLLRYARNDVPTLVLSSDEFQWESQRPSIENPEIVKVARTNAADAGVEEYIHFQQRDVKDLRNPKPYGFVITNPPYGERLEEKEALPALYRTLGEAYAGLDKWSMYIITSYEDPEKYIGRKADKNRKIYNGMIQARFYSFMGPKPPRTDSSV